MDGEVDVVPRRFIPGRAVADEGGEFGQPPVLCVASHRAGSAVRRSTVFPPCGAARENARSFLDAFGGDALESVAGVLVHFNFLPFGPAGFTGLTVCCHLYKHSIGQFRKQFHHNSAQPLKNWPILANSDTPIRPLSREPLILNRNQPCRFCLAC